MSQRSRVVAFVNMHPGSTSAQVSAGLGRDCSPDLSALHQMRHLNRRPGTNGCFLYYPAGDNPVEPVTEVLEPEAGNVLTNVVLQAGELDKIVEEAVDRRLKSVASDLVALRQLLDGVIERLA
jgi:hypothetical protein